MSENEKPPKITRPDKKDFIKEMTDDGKIIFSGPKEYALNVPVCLFFGLESFDQKAEKVSNALHILKVGSEKRGVFHSKDKEAIINNMRKYVDAFFKECPEGTIIFGDCKVMN